MSVREVSERAVGLGHAVGLVAGAHRLALATGRGVKLISEEDLDIKNMTDDELSAWWLLWLQLAQSTNDKGAGSYSHGVFDHDPTVPRS